MDLQPAASKRLESVLAQYLARVEAGEAVEPEELFERHPDLAGELRLFLEDDDRLKRIAMASGDERGESGGSNRSEMPIESSP